MADDAPTSSLPLTPVFRSRTLPSADSGYRTAPASGSQAFVIGDEEVEGVLNFDHLDLEDEVFDDMDQEDTPDEVERPLSVVYMRSRAFSYPFALSDFHLTIPLSAVPRGGSRLALDFERILRSSSRMTLESQNGEPSSRSPSVLNGGRGSVAPDEVDDVENARRSVSPAGWRPHLPDLVLSGARRFRPDAPVPDSSGPDLYALEHELASCLARLGDDFDTKYFTPNRAGKPDSPDSGGSVARISFRSAVRLWQHLTGSKPHSVLHQRQRSRSTAD